MDDSVIYLDRVTKTINGHDLVSDLTLKIGQGGLFGIIGPSGGGKSSTIRLMVGIYAPTSGEATVFGTPATRLSLRQRQRIGYMPQHLFLYPTLTAQENLSYIAGLYGIGWLKRRKVIPRLLRDVELWDARHRLAQNLSGGMLRRLQLAAVIMHEPSLIFVDEPMAGLDPLLREQMWALLRSLRDRGSSIIMTTQITQEAALCDSIAMIKDGRLIAAGSPEELRASAFGGAVTRVLVGNRMHEAMSILWDTPVVREVSRVGQNAIRLVTEPEDGALDQVLDRVRGRGVEILAVEKATPSFDEVFERLVANA